MASACPVCGVPPSHSTMGYQATRAVGINLPGQASLPCQGQIEQATSEVFGRSNSLIPPVGVVLWNLLPSKEPRFQL